MSNSMAAALDARAKLHSAPRPERMLRIPAKLTYSWWVRRFNGGSVRKTIKTFWGGKMVVVLPDIVSTLLYRYGFVEYGLSRAFIEYIKPGMTFFDVGAHFGYFTCLAAHLVGPAGRVHSFEPARRTFQILGENAVSRPNVTLNNVAAFSEPRTIQFNDFGAAYSAFNSFGAARLPAQERATLSTENYDVKAVTLDDYMCRTGAKPDVIKIDAESAEYDVLLGLNDILVKVKPAISIEVGDYALEGVASSSKVIQHLVTRGYRPHEWRDGALRPHDARSVYDYDNLLFLPGT